MEKHIDASEYRRRKKEEKDCLFQELDRCTEEIIHQDKAYQRYLDTQAVLDRYSVANAIMIADKNNGKPMVQGFPHTRSPAFQKNSKGGTYSLWCGRWDLNPYGLPYAPQTYASAYSATTA